MAESWIVPLVGAGFIAAGIWLIVRSRVWRRSQDPDGWVPAKGTIVDWEMVDIPGGRDPGSGSMTLVNRVSFPVVEYRLPAGSTGRFRNPTTRDFGYYPTPREVDIIVDPGDRWHAQMVNTAGTRRQIGWIHLVLGAGLVAIGLVAVGGWVLILLVTRSAG